MPTTAEAAPPSTGAKDVGRDVVVDRPWTFAEHVARAWSEALAVWGVAIELSPPLRWEKGTEDHWGGEEPLAFIDLVERQVVVNFELLHAIGAMGSLVGVLAHEIGHHVRYPHTLGLSAQLEVLQRKLIPSYPHSLTNLFWDLLVNERVGRSHAGDLAAVYRGFSARPGTTLSPMFAFYLTVYEELWVLEPGELVGAALPADIDEKHHGWRIAARVFTQTFWGLPDVYLQFVYFCSIFVRFVDFSTSPKGLPMSGDAREPDADDYADALYGNARISEALKEAGQRGWIDEATSTRADGQDPMSVVGALAGGRPGSEQRPFREAIASRHYRRLVDQHLFDVPPAPGQPEPEPSIPSTLEDWEWGDDPRKIDWTATILASGPLAAVRPLTRTLLPDDPEPIGQGLPAIEIWLDTSGSMPDPTTSVNALTLAAQILAAACLRKGGKVRACVYSWGTPLVSDWMYDEEAARRFLLQYAGGGTDYPFAVLREHVDQEPHAVHVVVSDADFLVNTESDQGQGIDYALARCDRFVALLGLSAYSDEQARKVFERARTSPRFRLVEVRDYAAFGRMATDLARALFGE